MKLVRGMAGGAVSGSSYFGIVVGLSCPWSSFGSDYTPGIPDNPPS
jgi:hypothetical protein